jgi:NO-binding membrane sensor protein with MHYT domain
MTVFGSVILSPYNHGSVTLSDFISTLASFAALPLAGRVTAATQSATSIMTASST